MTVTTAEGVQSGLAKNFFWQKTFDEIWERQKPEYVDRGASEDIKHDC